MATAVESSTTMEAATIVESFTAVKAASATSAINACTVALIAIYVLTNVAYLYVSPVETVQRSPLVAADTMLAPQHLGQFGGHWPKQRWPCDPGRRPLRIDRL